MSPRNRHRACSYWVGQKCAVCEAGWSWTMPGVRELEGQTQVFKVTIFIYSSYSNCISSFLLWSSHLLVLVTLSVPENIKEKISKKKVAKFLIFCHRLHERWLQHGYEQYVKRPSSCSNGRRARECSWGKCEDHGPCFDVHNTSTFIRHHTM